MSKVGIAVLNGPPLTMVKFDPVALAQRKLMADVVAPGMTGVTESVNVYGNGVDAKDGAI